jgi:hypothetical protein
LGFPHLCQTSLTLFVGSLGLEIRTQVTQYVSDKIRALRLNPGSVDPDNPEEPLITTTDPLPGELAATTAAGSDEPPAKKAKVDDEAARTRLALQPSEGYAYGNVSVLRGNAMKFLPNFFDKAQVCGFLLSPARFLWPVAETESRSSATTTALQNLLPLPRPSLQSSQAQGPNHLVCFYPTLLASALH